MMVRIANRADPYQTASSGPEVIKLENKAQ